MKTNNLNRQDCRNPTIACISILLTAIVYGCQENRDVVASPLSDIDWDQVEEVIFLNNEYLSSAKARFKTSTISDSTCIVLSGVHPNEEIEINVATMIEENGIIRFSGEQTIAKERNLKVSGIYASQQYKPVDSQFTCSMRVDISYSVPFSTEYTIKFDERCGFRYHRDLSIYPLATSDDDFQLDKEHICNRINSELALIIKSMYFRFGQDGIMTFGYTSIENNTVYLDYRYWIKEQKSSGNNIVFIENPQSFYKALLEAMTPIRNRRDIDMSSITQYNTATLFLVENEYFTNYLNLAKSIYIVDEMHHNIFPYLYDNLPDGWKWSDSDSESFDDMYKLAKSYDSAEKDSDFYNGYSWAFCNFAH